VSLSPPATTLPGAGTLAALAAAAALAIAVLVPLLRRRPDLLPPLALLALPFRVPISAGERTVNLLIPLHAVVAAASLALLLPRAAAALADARRGASGSPADDGGEPASPLRPSWRVLGERWLSPRGTAWLLAVAVGLYVLQTAYSADRAKGLENIVFFYIPFGLLFLALRGQAWTREQLARCLAVVVGLAVIFAGIGFVEYGRKALFLNPKVVAANQYDNYFRVNSLFFDPNIYGRFLALVMIAVAVAMLWSRRRRDVLLAAALLGWLLAGMITSFSQSSIAALLLGLALVAAWRWSLRLALAAAGLVVALGAALILLAPASLHFGLKGSGGSTSNATSGRTKLIEGGLELFAKRPLEGYGPGSFEREYKRHSHTNAENATSASHTIPVTIAAEQGLPGLLVYVALIIAALAVLLRGAGRSPPRVAVAACFAALLLHTWTYAAFLEDPSTWVLLAIGLTLAEQVRRPVLARAEAASSV
jgi:O-antigen ligase